MRTHTHIHTHVHTHTHTPPPHTHTGDWLTKYDDILPEMMADGIRVMIYAGELDLICNYLGNQRWVTFVLC